MARKFPPIPKLRRSVELFQPKVEIVIACEGRNTEPNYFAACVAHYGAGRVTIRVLEETGVPITVVRAAADEKQRLIKRARKLDAQLRPSFSVWAVFDRDDHDVSTALRLAVEQRVAVAHSNPCFELWPILHLMDYGAQDGRHALQRQLRELMPGYDHERSALINFDQIKDLFPIASERARRLNAARAGEECPGGCPSTGVVELVQKIAENGRSHFRKTR